VDAGAGRFASGGADGRGLADVPFDARMAAVSTAVMGTGHCDIVDFSISSTDISIVVMAKNFEKTLRATMVDEKLV